MEESVFESERFFPFVGWQEPKGQIDEFFTARFSRSVSGKGSTSHFPDVPLPEGWRWDGAWNAFKRDFVGDDAKMPNDYVETRFQSNRYASSRHFPSRSTRRIAMKKTDAFAFVPRARADAPPTPTRNNKFTTTKIAS